MTDDLEMITIDKTGDPDVLLMRCDRGDCRRRGFIALVVPNDLRFMIDRAQQHIRERHPHPRCEHGYAVEPAGVTHLATGGLCRPPAEHERTSGS